MGGGVAEDPDVGNGSGLLVVTAIESTGSRTVLSGASAAGTVVVTVAAVPDLVEAKRWLGGVRRLLRVEVAIESDGVVCVASGVGHRVPFVRRVPLPVAIGLGVLGSPIVVRGVASSLPWTSIVGGPEPGQ